MKKIRYIINGDVWKFRLLTNKEFVRIHSRDAAAITNSESKTVDFDKSCFKLKYVIHELVHVHCNYFYLDSASIKASQLEEIFCEFLSDRINLLKKQANDIFKKLK